MQAKTKVPFSKNMSRQSLSDEQMAACAAYDNFLGMITEDDIVAAEHAAGEDGSLLTGAGEDQSAVLKEHVATVRHVILRSWAARSSLRTIP